MVQCFRKCHETSIGADISKGFFEEPTQFAEIIWINIKP